MKKLFFFISVCLFLLVSCEPEPILSLDKESIDFSAEGGTQTIAVTANNVWNVVQPNTQTFFTVSPQGGEGNGSFTVTVQPNTTAANRDGQVVVTCTSRNISMTKTLRISQVCPAGRASLKIDEITPFDEGTKTMAAEGAVVKLTLTANAPWKLSCTPADVTLDRKDGQAGTFPITATVPACPDLEGRTITFSLSCMTSSGGIQESFSVKQAGGLLSYGGETYHAVKMKDGKWWMAENLRYVPSGYTPSSDPGNVQAGVYYPVVYDAANAAAVFSTADADIKANGYLYQSEVALGLKVGDITSEDQAMALEGARGLCPEGWHVPTRAEYVNLVGKSVGATTNTEAPYYDGSNGSLVMLNADGFNILPCGAVTINDVTKTSGSLMGALKGYERIASGFYCGSSFASVTYNTKEDPSSGIKNLMFTGLMPMTNKASEAEFTCNGSSLGFRSAASLRCVKD